MLQHDLQMKANRYARLVSEAIKPDCIILYGSVARNQAAVSYTHLTLPTSDLV